MIEQLQVKQDAMKARHIAKRSTRNAKANGEFKLRRLRTYPDYLIDENGRVVGPTGTELKYRWDNSKPYVRIQGKDRAVFWLLVDAGFQESPADKRNRRAAAKRENEDDNTKPNWQKYYNSLEEAQAEDPELYGYPDGRDM